MGDKVLSLVFNEDKTTFVSCMDSGIRLYNVDPLMELRRIETIKDNETLGGIGLCSTLYRSSIIFMASAGSNAKYSPKTLILYDDNERVIVAEATLNEEIKGIQQNTDYVFVVTKKFILINNYVTLKEIAKVETRDNPLGLLEVTPYTESCENQVMVFPGRKIGSIQIVELASLSEGASSSSPTTINAHQGELQCIAMNFNGTRVATASSKGTLIRVWDISRTKTLLVELRRGSDPATIYSINFSADSEYLCCASDKGTVHIFALKDTSLNKRSALSGVGILGTYGESQWAHTNFTVPDGGPCICAFGSNNTVIACCLDGTFRKYAFNEGKCKLQAFDVFLDLCDDEEF